MRLLGYVRTPTAAHRILDAATRSGVAGSVRVKFGNDGIHADVAAERGPAVLLVDAAFARPDCGGFTRAILTASPGTLLMITGRVTAIAAAQAVNAGSVARGACCVFPSNGQDECFTAAVAAAVGLVAESRGRSGPPRRQPAVELSAREVQVLAGIANGCSCEETSRDLMLSKETVKSHVRRLYRKLGARDRAHAVAIAFRSGLIR